MLSFFLFLLRLNYNMHTFVANANTEWYICRPDSDRLNRVIHIFQLETWDDSLTPATFPRPKWHNENNHVAKIAAKKLVRGMEMRQGAEERQHAFWFFLFALRFFSLHYRLESPKSNDAIGIDDGDDHCSEMFILYSFMLCAHDLNTCALISEFSISKWYTMCHIVDLVTCRLQSDMHRHYCFRFIRMSVAIINI